MKYVISVSKTYKHRGKFRHKSGTKRHWFVYYYDEDKKLHCDQVGFWQAMYYKTKKIHRKKFYCSGCDQQYVALVKTNNQKIECPNCFSI